MYLNYDAQWHCLFENSLVVRPFFCPPGMLTLFSVTNHYSFSRLSTDFSETTAAVFSSAMGALSRDEARSVSGFGVLKLRRCFQLMSSVSKIWLICSRVKPRVSTKKYHTTTSYAIVNISFSIMFKPISNALTYLDERVDDIHNIIFPSEALETNWIDEC
jgi:hypothetical protein